MPVSTYMVCMVSVSTLAVFNPVGFGYTTATTTHWIQTFKSIPYKCAYSFYLLLVSYFIKIITTITETFMPMSIHSFWTVDLVFLKLEILVDNVLIPCNQGLHFMCRLEAREQSDGTFWSVTINKPSSSARDAESTHHIAQLFDLAEWSNYQNYIQAAMTLIAINV